MLRSRASTDLSILLVVIALCGIGLVQVYSSSFIFASDTRSDGLLFFRKQAAFFLAGLGFMLMALHVPLRWLFRSSSLIWLLISLLLVLTFVPGLGHAAGGAARWIRFGTFFGVQPSEFVKIGLALVLASYFSRSELIWWKKLFFFIFLAVPIVLVLRQPDLGTALILLSVVGCTFFVQGLRLRYILLSFVALVPMLYVFVWNVAFRRERLLAFLDPWANAETKGFQVIQSLLGFHSGRLFGVGLGEGQSKLFFLPEAHTDFTLAVLGEETGFIGFLIVMVLFGFLIFKSFRITARLPEGEKRIMALALSISFALSVLINCAVVLALVPTKGLALPFLSYGGSSLVSNCILWGLILNLDRSQRLQKPLARRYASVIR